jgi:hypothetical protein
VSNASGLGDPDFLMDGLTAIASKQITARTIEINLNNFRPFRNDSFHIKNPEQMTRPGTIMVQKAGYGLKVNSIKNFFPI